MQKYTKILSCKKAVENFVEKFGRMWKKVENYSYFCTR